MINALSFDIEEWFHLLDIPDVSNTHQWDLLPQIVEPYTLQILETLNHFGIRATFFVVGWIAKKHPQLVQEISNLGHEVASHSYWHVPINRMNRKQFAEDLHRSVDTLQQITGQKVMGFRAPGFTITIEVGWAFEVLLDQGLSYDASLIPHRPQHFNCSPRPHLQKASYSQKILELPVSALPLGRFSIPYCGGGYLRLMPRPLLHFLMKRQNRLGLPNIVYLHPRDFAVDCPHIKLSPLRHFRTYHGISSTQLKLEFMLRNFQWDCCAAVLALIPASPLTRQPALQAA